MQLNPERIRALASERGYSVAGLLRAAGVSRTAFYSLARRPSVVPASVRVIARTLGVPVPDLLREGEAASADRTAARLAEARRICRRNRAIAFDDVWHALVLLDLPPVERLNRSLIRGRAVAVHR